LLSPLSYEGAGLLVTAPMAMIGGALNVSVIYVDGAAQTYRPETLRLMYDAQSLAFAATSAGIAAWFAWLAVLGNVVTMFTVLDAGAATIGFVGVGTFALFILVTGITMAAGKAKAPAGA
jgi:hypothetical protein